MPQERNAIHSVITALPVIMLVAGLYLYYSAESEQSRNAPIRAESESVSAIFTGLSTINTGSQGRHYLWLDEDGSARGVRFQPDHADVLNTMARGVAVTLKIAPSVHESSTYWAWYVEQNGTVYVNDEHLLQ